MLRFVLGKIIGTKNEREVKRLWGTVNSINALEASVINLSDDQLKAKTTEFRERYAGGETLDALLPEAFAVVRETAKRVLGERHFDVQLMGAIALHEGKIAEMKTGEGKTLTSTCAVYLNALAGKGVHVVTVNDYLARRDSEWMGAVYKFHGLSVGCIHHGINDTQRRMEYGCDITYGTNNEFGFDYLRDNMKYDSADLVQRGLNYAIVDEVDSILIDEARTPLIISGPTEDDVSKYYFVDSFIPTLIRDKDYVIDEKSRSVSLTEEGIKKLEKVLKVGNLYDPVNIEWLHYVTQALRAHSLFRRDVDYVVQDNKVMIVDEFTGRLLPGRRFSEGLHQALEAKEKVRVESENQTLATVTFQNYFRMYSKLSGMTGTAETEAAEFAKIYKLEVLVVPTNMPMVRKDLADQVYKNEKAKFRAVLGDIIERHNKGQPVLVGTISIEKSEKLSKMLKTRGIKHNVLNAKYHEKEAEIISRAGQHGAVTISTNMAGRGTDIKLGEGIAELGGLHVLATERHESRRIDNQLRGRSGRQGDAGSSRFYLSMEDELMRIFGSERIQRLMDTLKMDENEPIEHKWVTRAIENAQKKVEAHNFDIRKHLLEYDDVMNQQREVIYSMRKSMLFGENLEGFFLDIIREECESIQNSVSHIKSIEDIDFEELNVQISEEFNTAIKKDVFIAAGKELSPYLFERTSEIFKNRIKELPEGVYLDVCRTIFLQTLDTLWKEHLKNLDYLKESIGLRGYAQVNPLIAYKKEAFDMFVELDYHIKVGTLGKLFRVRISQEHISAEERRRREEESLSSLEKYKQQQEALQKSLVMNRGESGAAPVKRNENKVGRNDPCPCGSGKKYKKCCGR
ncbi:MAG: preprotein translocase subunit SecA [Oligoflexia bacterium]|nr:preprotein translocase subunit SecA [Oligoflexia bacterium]